MGQAQFETAVKSFFKKRVEEVGIMGDHDYAQDSHRVPLTPDVLRQRTLAANKGAASQAEALRLRQLEERIQRSIEFFEKDAAEQAAKGNNFAIGLEVDAGKATTFSALSAEDKALFARMKDYYEGRGFTTEVYGPYVDGGPSHPYTGFDLLVYWV